MSWYGIRAVECIQMANTFIAAVRNDGNDPYAHPSTGVSNEEIESRADAAKKRASE